MANQDGLDRGALSGGSFILPSNIEARPCRVERSKQLGLLIKFTCIANVLDNRRAGEIRAREIGACGAIRSSFMEVSSVVPGIVKVRRSRRVSVATIIHVALRLGRLDGAIMQVTRTA